MKLRFSYNHIHGDHRFEIEVPMMYIIRSLSMYHFETLYLQNTLSQMLCNLNFYSYTSTEFLDPYMKNCPDDCINLIVFAILNFFCYTFFLNFLNEARNPFYSEIQTVLELETVELVERTWVIII